MRLTALGACGEEIYSQERQLKLTPIIKET